MHQLGQQIWVPLCRRPLHRQHATYACRPTFMHICGKPKSTATFTSQVISKDVSDTNTPPNWPYFPNTHHSYMGDVCTYKITGINQATGSIVHISLNKYGCHFPNIAQTVNMLYGLTYPIFLEICTKAKPTAQLLLHLSLLNMP